MDVPPPTTPQKTKETSHWIRRASDYWDLNLPTSRAFDSPNKREKLLETADEEVVCGYKIINYIIFLCGQKDGRKRIEQAIRNYEIKGSEHYSGWVTKPLAARGVLPEAQRRTQRPVTQQERRALQDLLRDKLQEQCDQVMERGHHGQPPSANRVRTPAAPDSGESVASTPTIEDTPIPFNPLGTKRPIESQLSSNVCKKARVPLARSLTDMGHAPSSVNQSMGPPLYSREESFANTDFNSVIGSVFDDDSPVAPEFLESGNTVYSTQDTVPLYPMADQKSSEYFGSSIELTVVDVSMPAPDEEASLGKRNFEDMKAAESKMDSKLPIERLRSSLVGIFPNTPEWMAKFPLVTKYEITRVFLYCVQSMPKSGFPYASDLDVYDTLWERLKAFGPLVGRAFPERSNQEAWNAAFSKSQDDFRGVVLSGTLRFATEDGDPLFELQLKPMRLLPSHRLSRRYGNDRFLEIDIPDLTHKKMPRLLSDMGIDGLPEIARWLVNTPQKLCGRRWRPFFTKSLDRKDRKVEDSEVALANRIYFYADEMTSISELLNSIRPTRKNMHQPYQKLFARSSLAVSRNTATVTLNREQIIDKDDLLYGTEIMTDGAGRLSLALAQTVKDKLGFKYLPSGFQGRIGEAQGFWQVDHYDRTNKFWIEVYESQRKWTRSTRANGESEQPSHRTFEVLRCSSSLKSADLNTQFLPILIARAKNQQTMRETIANILKEGLQKEIEALGKAMQHPETLRKWVRDLNPNFKERLRDGMVAHRAGLPAKHEEILNFLLDAGFSREQTFLHDCAWSLAIQQCDTLKRRMNITVDKSTYVYMVPDFAGVLEPNEVYLDFSGFVEETSGFAGETLSGLDILVARAPAHFPSDIQRVTAVAKVELMGLKDVIVFSTKGNPSLAAKLSGGDYDGDLAWICWEQSLVTNFENAEIPNCPNLVKEGYLRKETTSYGDLVSGRHKKVSHFLTESFIFNLQPSMLGICTVFKDNLCYTQKSVETRECIFLSTLLSNLVDQAKQGYIFTRDDWTKITRDVIKIKPMQPKYKDKNEAIERNSENIIDYLTYVANETVKTALANLHASLVPKPTPYDEDLMRDYLWANKMTDPQWTTLVRGLISDLLALRTEWETHFCKLRRSASNSEVDDELKPGFVAYLLETYGRYKAIVPHDTTSPFTQGLLGSRHGASSTWTRLKASTLFGLYRQRYVANFVWWMAGNELAAIKATASRYGPVLISAHMNRLLQPNSSLIKQAIAQKGLDVGLSDAVLESQSVTNPDNFE